MYIYNALLNTSSLLPIYSKRVVGLQTQFDHVFTISLYAKKLFQQGMGLRHATKLYTHASILILCFMIPDTRWMRAISVTCQHRKEMRIFLEPFSVGVMQRVSCQHYSAQTYVTLSSFNRSTING